MKFTQTKLDGVVIIEPTIFGDERGYFYESFKDEEFRRVVCNTTFVQENQSKSTKGVVRGVHFQAPPHVQAKLIRVVQGRVLDVALDLRKGSPTYGEHVAVELSADNNKQLFIPRGFAHGFSVLSEEAVLQYKCDNYYSKESEGTIAWDDPDLRIDWKVPEKEIILSEKDKRGGSFKDFASPFRYE